MIVWSQNVILSEKPLHIELRSREKTTEYSFGIQEAYGKLPTFSFFLNFASVYAKAMADQKASSIKNVDMWFTKSAI